MLHYSSFSLYYLASPISSSFSIESLVLVHGLEWCRSQSCHLLLSVSTLHQLPVSSYFFSAPTLLRKVHLECLVPVRLPTHCKLPLVPSQWSKPEQRSPPLTCPLAPDIAKLRLTRYSAWKRNLSPNIYLPNSFSL